jgi:transcriptional regulator with XRE-family HTH domain
MDAGRAGRGRRHAGDAPTCGQLLRRYRSAAGLTQEELAERAGYSANYIGKLERDLRELPAAAAERLAGVLGLADEDLSELQAARERRGGSQGPPAGLLAGRDAEMAQIRRLLAGAGPPVLLLAGEPGMGKTRLLEEAAGQAADSRWGIARGGCWRRPPGRRRTAGGASPGAAACGGPRMPMPRCPGRWPMR